MNSIWLWTLPLLGGGPAEPQVISVPQIRTVFPATVIAESKCGVDDVCFAGRLLTSCQFGEWPADAFDAVASPDAITESNDAGQTSGKCEASASKSADSYVVFDAAANIAVPGYDRFGGRLDQEGAVIYEGMAIRICDEGHYTVRYVIETPATEVMLRMQFVLLKPCCPPAQPGAFEQIGTITLPPTRFRPDSNALTDGRPLQWKVEQHGYSHHLKKCNQRELRMERTATAIFGTASK